MAAGRTRTRIRSAAVGSQWSRPQGAELRVIDAKARVTREERLFMCVWHSLYVQGSKEGSRLVPAHGAGFDHLRSRCAAGALSDLISQSDQ